MISKIKTVLVIYKTKGLIGVKYLFKDKIFTRKKDVKKTLYLKYFIGKKGIEIGGPSSFFSKEVPIYKNLGELDGCNFSTSTVWEGNIQEGENYNFFENRKGYQFICEASELSSIPSEKYDFLISSHCLEHCANPLKAIREWLRVIKKGGVMLLILPDRRYTFDHSRLVTSFGHLEEDFSNDVDERDLTHIAEILELHDLNMDLSAGTKEQFESRSKDNYKNRCLHHHVFDLRLLKKIYHYNNIKIIDTTLLRPYHQIILGIKK
jgi:SAM-dependent methyltransferase